MGVENISTFGGQVDSLFTLVLILTGIAFIATEAVLIYSLIRYRRRRGQKASYIHGNRRLEIIWTIIPGVLLFGLGVYQIDTWRLIMGELPPESESLVISVQAEQFEWHPTYPGLDGELGTDDDIVAPVNVIHIPVNQKVIVNLTSLDVLHSFFVPALRIKQDAVPGLPQSLWFEATTTGEFEVACAELCGLGHYRMRSILIVEEEDAFEAWLADIASR